MRREKACDWWRVTGGRNETDPLEYLDNNSNNDKKEEEVGENEKARVPSQSPALVPASLHSTSENIRVNPACHSEYTVRAHGLKISSDVGGFGSGLWDASYHRILHVRPRKRGAEEHCEKIPLVPIFWNRKQNAGTLGIHAKHSQRRPPGLTVPPIPPGAQRSAQEDGSAADGHAELQDLLPPGQCRRGCIYLGSGGVGFGC